MSRMYQRLEAGDTAMGTIMTTHGQELVEILGYSGLDFVTIDMMISSLDWTDVSTMVLAAKRYDVTPWARVSAYPWDGNELNTAIQSRVMRALALGAECVMASVNTADDVSRLLHPVENAHRRFYIVQHGPDRTHEQRMLDELEPEQRVLPTIESASAISNIESILRVKGLKMVFLGMGDLTKALGHPGEERHPAIQDAVRRIVAFARERDIAVCANTLAHKGAGDISSHVTEGVNTLRELGVQAIMLPRPAMVVQRFYEKALSAIRGGGAPAKLGKQASDM